ncbi:MAG: hypothetical protein S4CHLAM81_15310 [Chlamydiales bacterium]|nr:hypothetical protein [Chlamydiales bacterium]MCH9636300.1 hypothetical protein [Chlamydiales bacterium]MCH9703965.1 hypothetical protein [Chlamydiota bacterium]
MSNPLNPKQQSQSSRLIQEIERQRIDRPKTENVADLIRYQAKAMQLDVPLYTAKKQQKELQQKQTKGKQEKLSKEDLKAFSPLVFHQVDQYEGLCHLMMSFNLAPEDKESLDQLLNQLLAMKKQGKLDPEELKKLNQIIQTLNKDLSSKLSPSDKQQYWSQIASMYAETEEMVKKHSGKAKTKAGKSLMSSLKDAVSEDKGIAQAKSQGHESLAQMFIEAILGKFMPKAEAQLMATALLLQFQNWAGTGLDDLLGKINDFGTALNDFNLSTFLQSGKPIKDKDGKVIGYSYPDGKTVKDDWDKERNACSRDMNELNNLQDGLKNEINQIDQKMKDTTDPKVLKGLKDLKAKLQKQQRSCGEAMKNLQKLQKIIGGPGDPPNPPGTMKITIDPTTGAATVTGTDGLSAAEDAVVSGDVSDKDDPGAGGLQTIYNDLKSDQQDYSNQSSSQQMELQLTMTEVQQMWTIVSTCMTTLNQSLMTLAQSIYK